MVWKRANPSPPSADDMSVAHAFETPEGLTSTASEGDAFSLVDPDETPPPLPDVTSLSIPSFPAFAQARRGLIRTEDVQTWYHDIVVPKYLEILEQSKAIQMQRQTDQLRVQRLQQNQTVTEQVQAENARLHLLIDAAARSTPADPDTPLAEARALANFLVADAEADMALERAKTQAAAESIRRKVEQEATIQLGELYTAWRDFHTARSAVSQMTQASIAPLERAIAYLRQTAVVLEDDLRAQAEPDPDASIPESAEDPSVTPIPVSESPSEATHPPSDAEPPSA